MQSSSADATWDEVRRTVRDEIGEASYQSWIGVLSLASVDGGTVEIAAPNRFICNRVAGRFGRRMVDIWRYHDSSVRDMTFVVARAAGAATDTPVPESADSPSRVFPSKAPSSNVVSPPPRDLDRANGKTYPKITADTPPAEPDAEKRGADYQSEPLNGKNRFDNFIVGKSNELAHAASRRVAESPAPEAAYNPLFLYGGAGLGKTHLMHSTAWEAQQHHPGRKVLYLTAEQFMHRFVSALRYKDTFAFKEEFRSIDLLLIDDFQFIGGKENTQEEFFHTFNTLIDQNRQVVISADRSPSDLEGVQERIKSRLNWGLVADIGPTDYELRLGILQAKADEAMREHSNLIFGPRVLEFIAHRVPTNARVLEGALKRLVANATLVGRSVTVEMAQDTLTDLVRAYDKRITIEDIQRRVSEHYNIKMSDMSSPRRARVVARPRQIAMFLSKELTEKSLPDIGRKFGGRDHTTVMHAVKRIAELCAEDPTIAEDVEMLKRACEGC